MFLEEIGTNEDWDLKKTKQKKHLHSTFGVTAP